MGDGGEVLSGVGASSHPDPEGLFAVWAISSSHMAWKSMAWVVQLLVPELLDAVRSMAVLPETLQVRMQFSRAFTATCRTFGEPQGAGFGVQGSGCRAQGVGFGV